MRSSVVLIGRITPAAEFGLLPGLDEDPSPRRRAEASLASSVPRAGADTFPPSSLARRRA